MSHIPEKHHKPETIEKIRLKALLPGRIEISTGNLPKNQTGKKNPMYGKRHTAETRLKISIAKQGQRHSQSKETRSKISKAKLGISNIKLIGRHRSEETKARIGQANKGHQLSEKARLMIFLAHKGIPLTEEHKAKISLSLMGNTRTLGNHYDLTEEERKRRGLAVSVARNKPENKAKAKRAYEKMWQKPEYRNKVVKAILLGNRIKPNKPEQQLQTILNELFPNEWKYVGDGQLIIGGKCPDFTNINGEKQLIELFGDYWHRGENPQDRVDHFRQYGFDCLIIWEHELKKPEGIPRRVRGLR